MNKSPATPVPTSLNALHQKNFLASNSILPVASTKRSQSVDMALASLGMVYSQAPMELCRSYTAFTMFNLPISPAANNSFALARPRLLTRWEPTCNILFEFFCA